MFGGAADRLDQALALRLIAGDEFELKRAGERATDDGPQMAQSLDAFLRLYTKLGTDGPHDASAADEATRAFWSEVDSLGLRQEPRRMSPKRTFQELAALRPGGAFGAAIARGEKVTRTLPRDPAMRAALEELGERPERLGPPRSDN